LPPPSKQGKKDVAKARLNGKKKKKKDWVKAHSSPPTPDHFLRKCL